MTLSEQLSEWNSVLPRVNVNEVIFTLDENLIVVNALGDLPLYKSHGFEEQVKRWLVRELSKREKDFKDLLQQMELNAWNSFPLCTRFGDDVTMNSSLSESMQVKGDYILASFLNEIENVDHAEYKIPLRQIKSTFSEDNAFKKDMQIVFDENYINHIFLGLF